MVKDYSTKNESFIRVVALFDEKQLDNKDFCLTLLNEELIGVDPYYPNLSDSMKEQIKIECEQNVWYFLREVVRIPAIGWEYSPLQLNLANASAIWQIYNSIDSYLISPRQTHKESTFISFALWINKYKSQELVIFNNSIDKAELIEEKLNNIKTPDYLDVFSERDKLIIYPKDTGVLDELLQSKNQIFFDVNTLHYLKYTSNRVETKYKQNKPKLMEKGDMCFRLYLYGGIHSYPAIGGIDTNINFNTKMIDSIEDKGYMDGRDGESVSLLRFTWEEMDYGEPWYKHMCSCLHNDPFAIAREIDLVDYKDEDSSAL